MELGLWQIIRFNKFKYKDCVSIFKANLKFVMFFELITD